MTMLNENETRVAIDQETKKNIKIFKNSWIITYIIWFDLVKVHEFTFFKVIKFRRQRRPRNTRHGKVIKILETGISRIEIKDEYVWDIETTNACKDRVV